MYHSSQKPCPKLYRARPRTHVVGVRKRGATLGQSIQVGSFNLFVAQGGNRVKALVIGKDEHNIGWLVLCLRCRRGRQLTNQKASEKR